MKSDSLTIEDLRRITPAVFDTAPHPAVSPVYEFIPTLPIVEALVARGWNIRSAHQNGHNDPFALHRIVFDVPEAPRIKAVGEVWPTATLYNSHNRTRRESLCLGLHRTVCKNQAQVMILGHSMNKIHIIGWHSVEIQSTAENIIKEFGDVNNLVTRMTNRVLSDDEVLWFGKGAMSVRRYDTPDQAQLFTTREVEPLLEVRREADAGSDVWSVFNRVQENVMYGPRGGIQEVRRNRNLNLGLWEVAKSFLN